MKEITFLHPEFFWLFLVLPVAILWQIWKQKKQAVTLKISSLKGFKDSNSLLVKLKPYLYTIRLTALSFVIIALARPRSVDENDTTNGIDIIMAMDVSGSMLANDLKPNRMEALKEVAANFVNERPKDRIGIVVYAAEAYTKIPITSDKTLIQESVRSIRFDNFLQDGTAIGMGLSTAVNRLKDSKAKSKVIILLTDGVNNAGFIDPETASRVAQQLGIKVYTIGIGTNGMAGFPYAYGLNGEILYKPQKVEIDKKLLQSIAKNTGGKYFRAINNTKLETIYNEINKLETSEIKEQKFYDYEEEFRPFLIIAMILLLVEIALRNTIFKSFI